MLICTVLLVTSRLVASTNCPEGEGAVSPPARSAKLMKVMGGAQKIILSSGEGIRSELYDVYVLSPSIRQGLELFNENQTHGL